MEESIVVVLSTQGQRKILPIAQQLHDRSGVFLWHTCDSTQLWHVSLQPTGACGVNCISAGTFACSPQACAPARRHPYLNTSSAGACACAVNYISACTCACSPQACACGKSRLPGVYHISMCRPQVCCAESMQIQCAVGTRLWTAGTCAC